MRALLIVLTAGLALLQSPQERQRHGRALRAERTAALLAAWERADGEAQARASAALAAARLRGAPLGAAPTLQALDAARWALEGPPESAAQAELRALVDALDVRVVPGAFAPAAEGLGEPLTVHVTTLARVAAPREVDVTLTWIAPDGARTRARGEAVGGRAFTARGFELFIRAPLSAPSLWRLELAAESGGASAVATPVPVACGSAPGSAAEDADAAQRAVAEMLAQRWQALVADGSRTALPPGSARPLGVAYGDARGTEWVWPVRAEPQPRCALVLLTPPEEATEAILLDPFAARWRAAGAPLGARVVAARLPYPLGSGGLPDLGAFLRELPGLRGLAADVPVYVVARGMAVTHLLPALSGDPVPGLAGAVLATAGSRGLPAAETRALELLIVGPSGDSASGQAGSGEARPGDAEPASPRRVAGPLLEDLELPGHVRDWLLQAGRVGGPSPPPEESAAPDRPRRPAPDHEGGEPPVEQQPRSGGDAEREPGGASGERGTEPRASAGGAAAEGADRS